MPLDYNKLLGLKIPDVTQDYTAKDCILYALALGFGHDPVDPRTLAFVRGDAPSAVDAQDDP